MPSRRADNACAYQTCRHNTGRKHRDEMRYGGDRQCARCKLGLTARFGERCERYEPLKGMPGRRPDWYREEQRRKKLAGGRAVELELDVAEALELAQALEGRVGFLFQLRKEILEQLRQLRISVPEV